MIVTKPDLFNFRAALFLVLDGYKLESVEGFCLLAANFWPKEATLLNRLRRNCCDELGYDAIKSKFEQDCDEIFADGSTKYKLTFSSVLADFLELVPHIHNDRSLTEDDLYFNAFNPHICEICGDEIDPGEPAFFRTVPCPAIRHQKCSRMARRTHEYAFIEYMVNEIAYHEQVFRFNECCTYKLSESPGISLKQHRKYGYSIDHDGSVRGIPFFGEFVMDFISGEEDYDLIKKYRPYHVYIEYLLRAIGFKEEKIHSIYGYKYLLREDICRHTYPQMTSRIDNINLSEIMFDKHIHKLISKEMIGIIYDEVFRRIFQSLGILVGDYTISLNGMEQTYSINDEANDSDISIVVDSEDIYCVDFEKSKPFSEYFEGLSDETRKLLDYCKQFGVDA